MVLVDEFTSLDVNDDFCVNKFFISSVCKPYNKANGIIQPSSLSLRQIVALVLLRGCIKILL